MIITNESQIRNILKRVTFAPSCVDMNWEWEVTAQTNGYLIRTTFQRPDRDTGKVERGFGRWWHVPDGTTPDAIVKTAYAAARLILEHELMESFRYDGVRIFDPHHDLDDLRAAAEYHRLRNLQKQVRESK